MIIEVVGKEIEKIKGDFESYLNGLNMVGEISYSQYSELYDEGAKQIQKAYELGKSDLEKENAELQDKLKNLASVAEVRLANWQKYEKENAELEKELKNKCVDTNCPVLSINRQNMKRIAELEKENAELKHQLKHRNCLDCSNHSSNLRMRNLDLERENKNLQSIAEHQQSSNMKRYFEIEELKKENAELKEKLNFSTQYYQGEKAKDNLTKAKICLEQLVSEITVGELEVDPNILQQAEQFLKSEAEK